MESTTISPNAIESPLASFQNSALEAAEKELETLRKEIESKKYLLDLDKKDLQTLNNFITTGAPWKFTESLGILEVEKEMKKAIKEGKLFTTSVAIEAIYYYMSKVEGTGKNTNSTAFQGGIEEYLKILKAVMGGLEKVKADTERVQRAEFVVAARREGIEPDSSVTEESK
jgi:hypothetical protein